VSGVAASLGRRPGPVSTLLRRRPELLIWLPVLAAWLAMIGGHRSFLNGTQPAGTAHVHRHDMPTVPGSTTSLLEAFGVAAAAWAVMVVAMMAPTAVPLLYRVAVDSLRRRRLRAMGLVLLGYAGLWTAAGCAALAAVVPAKAALPVTGRLDEWALVFVLLAAAGYELGKTKRRALRRCLIGYRLPPRGPAADRACLRAGLRHGGACLASCGPLMAVLLVAGHAHLALMVLITAVVWVQRLLVIGPRLTHWTAAALASTAVLTAVL